MFLSNGIFLQVTKQITMKKIALITIMLASGICNYVSAQESKGSTGAAAMTPEQQIDMRMQRMTKDLALTEQQQASVRQIMQQNVGQIEAAKQAKDRDKVKQIRQQANEQIAALLTPDQKEKFQKMQEDMHTNRSAQ